MSGSEKQFAEQNDRGARLRARIMAAHSVSNVRLDRFVMDVNETLIRGLLDPPVCSGAAAQEFWSHAADDPRISAALRAVCAENLQTVRKTGALLVRPNQLIRYNE